MASQHKSHTSSAGVVHSNKHHTPRAASAVSGGGFIPHGRGGGGGKSRIPPGVRPWLSRKLEELWGIDGQVYSHYILSVLLDGVDNEFLIETAVGRRESSHSGGRVSLKGKSSGHCVRLDSSFDSDDETTATGEDEQEAQDADSFTNRKKAVVAYLNRLAKGAKEVDRLVEELLERLGYEVTEDYSTTEDTHSRDNWDTTSRTPQAATRRTKTNYSAGTHGNQDHLAGAQFVVNRCASLNDCARLRNEEKSKNAGWIAFKMGRNKQKRTESGNKRGNLREQARKTRGRIASLDECQSVFLPKLILKSGRHNASSGTKYEGQQGRREYRRAPRESSRKRFSSEDSSSCDVHSESHESNFGPPNKSQGLRNTSSFLIDCSSDCEDADEFFDFSISFLDSYDDIDETYNEAFPSLIETHNGQHFIALATCQNSVVSVGKDRCEGKEKGSFEVTVGASRASLPANPVSKGQPVWSSKVKAPIGRPLNRKYADAEISNSIIEGANVLLTIDEVVKRSNLNERGEDDGKSDVINDCPLNSCHSFLAERELESILNMIGLTPEKMPGMKDRSATRANEGQFNLDVSESLKAFSMCTKDLFRCRQSSQISTEDKETECDVKQGLLSPELSKIWDRGEAESVKVGAHSGLEASSSLNSLVDSDDHQLQNRKMSNGTINPDPVWMPTEADLDNALNSNTVTSSDPRLTKNSLLANVEIAVTVPSHEACFDLLAGFPGILLSPDPEDNEGNHLRGHESEKCKCINKISSSFCTCEDPDAKFPDVYFSTYNPQLFDLLDLYMLGENIGFTTNGSTDLFTLGNFYRKRDIYFDDYFAENIPSSVEQRPISASDSALPPLLTEHFLMEIMKFNEQCSPSTPVGSEFDTGSLYDDRSSEVTTLQQRANSLIMRHQRMYQQNVNTNCPDTVDASMQTDADQNEEEHRISPQAMSPNVMESVESTLDPSVATLDPVEPVDDDLVQLGAHMFAEIIGTDDSAVCNIEQSLTADNPLNQNLANFDYQFEPKLTPWSVASSSYVTDSQDAFNAANTTSASPASEQTAANTVNEAKPPAAKDFETFKCPAGCDPHADPSVHSHHVQEENLLISPKTHFRPISVQSAGEDQETTPPEIVYDEQITIQQTFDDLVVQSNGNDVKMVLKDSRLFTSWSKGNLQPETVNISSKYNTTLSDNVAKDIGSLGNPSDNIRSTSAALRSIWERSPHESVDYLNGGQLATGNEQSQLIKSTWDSANVDKGSSSSKWVTSSNHMFDTNPVSLAKEFVPKMNMPEQHQELFECKNSGNNDEVRNQVFDLNPVEELEFVFDHEMNEHQSTKFLNLNHHSAQMQLQHQQQHTPVFQTEFPVGFIPMETLSDVDCKCVADLPGELGIDPNCQLHGAGAAIYITTGDNHSLSSGGDWSIGSSSSFRALPATTAFNPNLIVGYQSGTFGSYNGPAGNPNTVASGAVLGGVGGGKKKAQQAKAANVNAANILQLNQSIVSQRQKKRSRSSKSEKDAKSASKPCSYFMEGGCHRSDCKFSHDLGNIPCRFFAEGGCFKSIFCPFRHALPSEVNCNSGIETAPGPALGANSESTEELRVWGASIEKSAGSSDSVSTCEMFYAKDSAESDFGWQPLSVSEHGSLGNQWAGSELGKQVTSTGNMVATMAAETVAKPKASKRRRCKTRSKKNAPNVKDKSEFPILPNDVVDHATVADVLEGGKEAAAVGQEAAECEEEQEASGAQLRLNSIYPSDGFCNFTDVAVM